MIANLPIVIINLMCLTAGICMIVRFKSKVTRGFFSCCRFVALADQEKPLGPGYNLRHECQFNSY